MDPSVDIGTTTDSYISALLATPVESVVLSISKLSQSAGDTFRNHPYVAHVRIAVTSYNIKYSL
jgi:hypothetical protein